MFSNVVFELSAKANAATKKECSAFDAALAALYGQQEEAFAEMRSLKPHSEGWSEAVQKCVSCERLTLDYIYYVGREVFGEYFARLIVDEMHERGVF